MRLKKKIKFSQASYVNIYADKSSVMLDSNWDGD